MVLYINLLVFSVFLGTKLFAISTPLAQITPYRVLVMGLVVIFIYKLYQDDNKLKISPHYNSTKLVSLYLVWWLWGGISVVWAIDFKSWVQAMFLLTIGVISLVSIYLYTKDMNHFKTLVNIIWWAVLFLMIWGYFEIVTNHYAFADMSKLDKHGIFPNRPFERIPITYFSNQNDYATLLLIFIPISLIKYKTTSNILGRIFILISLLCNIYLVYRSESRMIALCLVMYLLVFILLQFKLDLKKSDYFKLIGIGILLIILALVFIPKLRGAVRGLFYFNEQGVLSGDTKRMSLWRNGLIFLASTLGLGVGAGNIEEWVTNYQVIPAGEIVNMHNWWLEILVGYGIVVFVLYLIIYFGLIKELYSMRDHIPEKYRHINNSFLSFLIVYIFASITSSNNMNIEWHWVFFGVIFAYLRLLESKFGHRQVRKGIK